MKKTAKHFIKADQFFVQRKGTDIYMSDGCFILKVPVFDYNVFFRPVSGMFIELEDGEKAARRYKSNNGMPVKEDGCDLAKYIEEHHKHGHIRRTSILMEVPNGRKKNIVRFFLGKDRIPIAERYAEIAEEAEIRHFEGNGTRIDPVFGSNGTYDIVILPVNIWNVDDVNEDLEAFVNI